MKGYMTKELGGDMACLLFLKTLRKKNVKGAISVSFARKKFSSFEFATALARIRESVSVLAVSPSLCIMNFHESFTSL